MLFNERSFRLALLSAFVGLFAYITQNTFADEIVEPTRSVRSLRELFDKPPADQGPSFAAEKAKLSKDSSRKKFEELKPTTTFSSTTRRNPVFGNRKIVDKFLRQEPLPRIQERLETLATSILPLETMNADKLKMTAKIVNPKMERATINQPETTSTKNAELVTSETDDRMSGFNNGRPDTMKMLNMARNQEKQYRKVRDQVQKFENMGAADTSDSQDKVDVSKENVSKMVQKYEEMNKDNVSEEPSNEEKSSLVDTESRKTANVEPSTSEVAENGNLNENVEDTSEEVGGKSTVDESNLNEGLPGAVNVKRLIAYYEGLNKKSEPELNRGKKWQRKANVASGDSSNPPENEEELVNAADLPSDEIQNDENVEDTANETGGKSTVDESNSNEGLPEAVNVKQLIAYYEGLNKNSEPELNRGKKWQRKANVAPGDNTQSKVVSSTSKDSDNIEGENTSDETHTESEDSNVNPKTRSNLPVQTDETASKPETFNNLPIQPDEAPSKSQPSRAKGNDKNPSGKRPFLFPFWGFRHETNPNPTFPVHQANTTSSALMATPTQAVPDSVNAPNKPTEGPVVIPVPLTRSDLPSQSTPAPVPIPVQQHNDVPSETTPMNSVPVPVPVQQHNDVPSETTPMNSVPAPLPAQKDVFDEPSEPTSSNSVPVPLPVQKNVLGEPSEPTSSNSVPLPLPSQNDAFGEPSEPTSSNPVPVPITVPVPEQKDVFDEPSGTMNPVPITAPIPEQKDVFDEPPGTMNPVPISVPVQNENDFDEPSGTSSLNPVPLLVQDNVVHDPSGFQPFYPDPVPFLDESFVPEPTPLPAPVLFNALSTPCNEEPLPTLIPVIAPCK